MTASVVPGNTASPSPRKRPILASEAPELGRLGDRRPGEGEVSGLNEARRLGKGSCNGLQIQRRKGERLADTALTWHTGHELDSGAGLDSPTKCGALGQSC
jgi:hypothetical protein